MLRARNSFAGFGIQFSSLVYLETVLLLTMYFYLLFIMMSQEGVGEVESESSTQLPKDTLVNASDLHWKFGYGTVLPIT